MRSEAVSVTGNILNELNKQNESDKQNESNKLIEPNKPSRRIGTVLFIFHKQICIKSTNLSKSEHGILHGIR